MSAATAATVRDQPQTTLLGSLFRTLLGGFVRLVTPLLYLNIVPDAVVRIFVRFFLYQGLHGEFAGVYRGGLEASHERKRAFLREIAAMPIAVQTRDANEQHYEVPTAFYDLCLGQRKKYSSCIWGASSSASALEEAERTSLAQVCERAGVEDGMSILDLGCGWGSLSLWLAEHYPKARIVGLSNSNTQREYIMGKCREHGYSNVTILTKDINDFDTELRFDRVLTIEMFEHMKNYHRLMANVSRWLNPGGKLFVHIFVHKLYPYHFLVRNDADWMAKYFFSGGTMPAPDTLVYCQGEDLRIEDSWQINGKHYAKTLDAWLARMDANLPKVHTWRTH
jgi:cyclopropane-fatty-acyl-phospholipid synthase